MKYYGNDDSDWNSRMREYRILNTVTAEVTGIVADNVSAAIAALAIRQYGIDSYQLHVDNYRIVQPIAY